MTDALTDTPAQTITTHQGHTLHLRPARPDDLAGYIQLRLEALRDHPEAFGSDYTESQQRTPAEWQQRLTRTPHFTLFLAVTAAGTLAGMTGISREAGVKLRHNANIISVYVAPAWRGQGVVAALLALSLAQARDWEVRRVRLAVAATNIAAIRAYVRGGFTVYGVDPEVIYTGGRYYDELLMQRPV